MNKLLLLLLLLTCPLAEAAQNWAFVQQKSARTDSASTTISVTMDAPITNGNTLVVFIGWYLSDTTTTPSSVTASWTRPSGARATHGDIYSDAQYAVNVTSAPQTITVTFGTSVEYRRLQVVELSGVASFESFAAQFQDSTVGTGTDAFTSGNLTTADADSAVIGWYHNVTQVGAGTGTISAGTNFTDRNGADSIFRAESRNAATAGSYAATFTKSIATDAFVMAIAFEQAGGGGGVLVNPMSGRGGAAAQPIF